MPLSEKPQALSASSIGPKETEARERARGRDSPRFPVVGIGASAGGLEAIELFLKSVARDSGMAYVVVQHLDPTHESVMPELLRRITSMSVVQVADKTKVRPDCVYTIPPNKDISILRGSLYLFDFPSPRGLRLPIDFFFRSLADDQGDRAVGVILSGTGSDGTLGLRAIKGRGGICLVQEPSTAKFDGMPRSAIDDGLADFVAPPEDLPLKIAEYLLHAALIAKDESFDEPRSRGALEKILILLRSRTGNDFSLYKRSVLYRRIERRMGIHSLDSIALYVRFARENPQELDILFKELLIGVTSFFRDAEAWEALKKGPIAALVGSVQQREARHGAPPLRAWVAGCSTGEEAYSLAIALKETMDEAPVPAVREVQIFATDLDREAIETARQGLFSASAVAELSSERLQNYFAVEDRGFRVRKDIREMIIFAPQNLIMDPPFTKLDLVCCRNLLIYFSAELQKKLLPALHYSLNPGGYLFLGSAESIGSFTDLFSPIHLESRIYSRIETAGGNLMPEIPVAEPRRQALADRQGGARVERNVQSLADEVLLQKFSPAAVLVTDKGDIIYTSGRTGKYLEPAAGKADWNIFAMARKGLGLKLESAFFKALREPVRVSVRGVEVENEGGSSFADLTVQALAEPEALKGSVMITFAEAKAPESSARQGPDFRPDSRSESLGLELHETQEELRVLREGIQAYQEESKSFNEELQSTNEELQSTIEELTTSKEEMQSLYEELQVVNGELQAKVDELEGASDDMKNLLNSTGIAALFLDERLCVRRFTTQTVSITRLIAADLGRPVTDIASELLYPRLAEDVAEVLGSLAAAEREIQVGDGRWFSVRILPYRTSANVIDGVVITFSDITLARRRGSAFAEAGSPQ